VLVAGALGVALHALLFVPIRPTLVGSAAPEASPTMIVRILTKQLADGAVDRSPAPAVEPAATVATAPLAATRERLGDRPADVGPALPAHPVGAKVPAPAGVAPTLVPMPEPGLPPAPAYFAGGKLDPGPRPLEDVDPLYPEEAQQQEGSVVLRLLINEAGIVDNAAVVRAYPTGLFERSALEAFGQAKFSPGRILGVAVKSQITIEVLFTPINRGKVSGRSY
jgi:periplasmic protein TonB